jgi:hypothetical protein
MVVAKKYLCEFLSTETTYQFNTLKNGIFFSRAGTLARAMTSLYTRIWMTVTSAITYICPRARIVKKPASRINVHNVRTLKLTTFFCLSVGRFKGMSSGTGAKIDCVSAPEEPEGTHFIYRDNTSFSLWMGSIGVILHRRLLLAISR